MNPELSNNIHFESKGFMEAVNVTDFPIRDHKVILRIRRRRWTDLRTGKSFSIPIDLDIVAKGTRYSKEFGAFLKESVNPVCYNGDIFTVSDAAELKAEFPELESIMCGRGLLSNPALVRELQGGETLKKEELHRFHDTLYESYRTLFAPDERSVLFKMKELWGYFITAFQGAERDVKKIKKPQHFAEYEAAG